MLTDLEQALTNIVDTFHNYSTVKGNNHALYRDDLKKMITNECPQYTQKKDADTWFKELDFNEDNAVNFEEFLVLLIKVGVAAHRDSHKH